MINILITEFMENKYDIRLLKSEQLEQFFIDKNQKNIELTKF